VALLAARAVMVLLERLIMRSKFMREVAAAGPHDR